MGSSGAWRSCWVRGGAAVPPGPLHTLWVGWSDGAYPSGPPGPASCLASLLTKGAVCGFQGRLGRMSRWRRGARPCSPTASSTRSS